MGARAYAYVRRHHLALVALFVALGGTAWAGSKIGPNQIKKNAVRAKHVKDASIGTAEIANDGSPKVLTGNDIDESTLGKVSNAANTDRLGGQSANAFLPAGRVRNTGRIAVDDPVAGDTAVANRTLLRAGPFSFRALCGNDSDGSLEESAVMVDQPAGTSMTGERRENIGATSIHDANAAASVNLVSVAGTGNAFRSADVQLVAPSGAALRAAVSAEVNDGGADCSYAITAIAP